MTDREAIRAARRLFGRKAVVIHWTESCGRTVLPYSVGIRKGWFDKEMLGHGKSWEEAFEDAKRNQLRNLGTESEFDRRNRDLANEPHGSRLPSKIQ